MYNTRPNNGSYSMTIIAIIMMGMVTSYAEPVLMPFLLSCFLAITIQPALLWLNQYMHRFVSLILVMILLAGTIVGGSSLLLADAVALTTKAPIYAQRFKSMGRGILAYAEQHGVHIDVDQLPLSEGISWVVQFVTSGLQSILTVIAETVLVLFMMVFLVMEAPEFRKKIAASFADTTSEMMLDVVDSIVNRIQTYMITKTVISLATGLCTSLVTYFLGVDFYLLWGILAFLLNFIPNVGSIIAVFPPVLISLLQFDTFGPVLSVMVGLGAVQMTIGNVIEPRIMGRSLNLSTLVVFVSMIFWGWLWGMIGVVLAVPLTAAIKIVCEHIEGLRPLAILLGERSEDVATVPIISSVTLPILPAVNRSSSNEQLSATSVAGSSPIHPPPRKETPLRESALQRSVAARPDMKITFRAVSSKSVSNIIAFESNQGKSANTLRRALNKPDEVSADEDEMSADEDEMSADDTSTDAGDTNADAGDTSADAGDTSADAGDTSADKEPPATLPKIS